MNILGIGIATLDIVNTVDGYPREDSKVRRGGNVTNTLVVLSQLGHRCSWGGVLAKEPDTAYILRDLERHHIDYRYCRQVEDGTAPTSYILLNRRNGSRTIIHYRDLPEFTHREFRRIDLSPFHWIHFEGRDVAHTRKMLERCVAEPDLCLGRKGRHGGGRRGHSAHQPRLSPAAGSGHHGGG